MLLPANMGCPRGSGADWVRPKGRWPCLFNLACATCNKHLSISGYFQEETVIYFWCHETTHTGRSNITLTNFLMWILCSSASNQRPFRQTIFWFSVPSTTANGFVNVILFHLVYENSYAFWLYRFLRRTLWNNITNMLSSKVINMNTWVSVIGAPWYTLGSKLPGRACSRDCICLWMKPGELGLLYSPSITEITH